MPSEPITLSQQESHLWKSAWILKRTVDPACDTGGAFVWSKSPSEVRACQFVRDLIRTAYAYIFTNRFVNNLAHD